MNTEEAFRELSKTEQFKLDHNAGTIRTWLRRKNEDKMIAFLVKNDYAHTKNIDDSLTWHKN